MLEPINPEDLNRTHVGKMVMITIRTEGSGRERRHRALLVFEKGKVQSLNIADWTVREVLHPVTIIGSGTVVVR